MPEWAIEFLDWIRLHPGLAGITIGLVAFLEGLAFVGVLVPGIIILFGFGALVGLGVLDLATVWLWCSVGAIVGDALSFWLGHHFKDHVKDIWPFRRFPRLMTRGEIFFSRHGLKSIIIGRFVGPIRPIMPVVAGMMRMPIKRYLPANIVAGIFWAPAYLLPGVVFGASIELARAVAWRLALLLLILVAGIWLLSWLIGAIYRLAAPQTAAWLSTAMDWSLRHPVLGRAAANLVDPKRPESGTLALLAVTLMMAAWALAGLLFNLPQADAGLLDQRVAEAMAQLRSPMADQWMLFFNALGSLQVLLPASLLLLLWLLYRRCYLAAGHWAAAVAVGLALALIFGWLLGAARGWEGVAFRPITHVSMSVATYGFMAILLARELPLRARAWPYVVAAVAVGIIAFSRLYLRAHDLSDLLVGFLLAAVWVIGVGIAYRRRKRRSFWVAPTATLFFVAIGVAALIEFRWHGERVLADAFPASPPQVIEAIDWWVGAYQPEEPGEINVQLAGNPEVLLDYLRQNGWASPPPADWQTPVAMLQPQPTVRTLPLFPATYRDREEYAVVAIEFAQGRLTALRLWPTAVRLAPGSAPLWLGRVSRYELRPVLFFFRYWRRAGPGSLPDLGPGLERRQLDDTLLIRTTPEP